MNKNIISYTMKEFLNIYRRDGYGYIKVADYEPIKFKEVICDICNYEILEDNNNKNKKVVFILDDYALCEKCALNTKKG